MTYNMPILGSSAQLLVDAVNGQYLTITDETYSGCEGSVYAVTDHGDLEWHDEFALLLCGRSCQVNLYALPTAEYVALLQAGSAAKAFDLTGLVQALQGPEANAALITSQLLDVVRRDKVSTTTIRYTSSYTSVWLTSNTRFCHTKYGWYVILQFETQGDCRPVTTGKAAFGLDVGISPVITAVDTRGNVSQIGAPPIIPVEQALQQAQGAREAHLVKRIAQEAQYSVVRAALEQLITELIEHATVVVVEDLDLPGLKRLPGRADLLMRNLGVIDFLQAWLPQRLAECGVRLYRYPAAYTSQVCGCCYSRGTRLAQEHHLFQCSKCGFKGDAHVNSASVLAKAGLSAVLQELREQLRRPGVANG